MRQPKIDLFLPPLQTPRHRARSDRIQPIDQNSPPIQTHHLQDFVFGPDADGNVEYACSDVHESCFAHHVGEVECRIEVYAKSGEAIEYIAPVLGNGVVRGHAAVVGLGVVVDFLKFEVAAWFEMTGNRKLAIFHSKLKLSNSASDLDSG